MLAADRTLFLLVNAGFDTPTWVIGAARLLSAGVPIAVPAALLLVAVLRPRRRAPLLVALLATTLCWCAVVVLRDLLPMPRPAAYGLGIQWLPHGVRAGFPSLHTAAAFAFAGTLAWLRWQPLASGLLLLALGVGWSRVLLGLHFPSDVLGGALLGLAVAGATVAVGSHVRGGRTDGRRRHA
ncbi:MAG TPA: phosphatase PAP2 family protein [Ottowia sp.]|uniref:phosphatase PAP2 family protein n=1 Tax=Ottowia sp. TaxID=1898956 RepID=UPI002CECCB78|nr:phosphatase PAP2 family protein [Ottowia sp.]HMN21688.1 phosphatase PAP2 family protein [Ottowia sp.]